MKEEPYLLLLGDYRALFEALPGLYLVLARDLTIVAASDAYLKATMTERAALIGQHLFEAFPDDPADPRADGVLKLTQSLHRVLKKRVTDTMMVQRYAVRRPQAQGGGFEERYWLPSNSPLLDTSGEVRFIIHRVEDITEIIKLRDLKDKEEQEGQKLKIQILAERETFFTVALDMLCIAGTDGYFKRLNPVWQEVLGLTSTELCAKPFVEFIHPDDRQATQKETDKLRVGMPVLAFENRYRHKDGSYRWLSWKAVPVGNSVYGAARDITEQKMAEQDLKRALAAATLYARGLDEATIVAFTDRRGIITHVNELFCKISGYSQAELLGQNHRILNSQTHSREFFVDLWTTISSGKNWRGEICNRTKTGELYWVDTTIVPSFDEKGKIDQYLSIRIDITQRKEVELKLLQSAKMSILGEMAGGIAHEINTPLAIIKAKSSQLMRRLEISSLDNNLFTKELEKIVNTVDRIAKIIKGLLAFSRTDERIAVTGVYTSEIINDTMELCGEKFRYSGIEFRLKIDQDCKVECRPTQISQVLLNLLNNAYDAVKNCTEKWIEVEAAASGSKLIFKIADSGHGIPEEIKDRIMQPFFTTKDIDKGTGLGLSISKGIVESHQGKLYLDNAAKHTRFVIEIPLSEPKNETKPQATTKG